MKKLIVELFVLVMIVAGCGQVPAEPVVDDVPKTPEPVSEDTESEDGTIANNTIQCISMYEEERFLNKNQLYFHDGWIFGTKSNDVIKYKPDLTEETIVFSPEKRSDFVLNQDGFGMMLYIGNIYNPNDNNSMYILDIHTGEAEEMEIAFSPTYAILYKGVIIVQQQYGPAPPQLDMYDRNGNFVKTIVPDVSQHYAFIDNSVYYLPFFSDDKGTIPGNSVMRYDLESGITEKILEFDLVMMPWGEYGWPRVYFNGRTIIVNNLGSIFYTNVDKIEPIEIVFDFVKGRDDFSEFIPSTDDDIFLMFARGKYDEAVNDMLYDSGYYRIVNGKSEPILLNEFSFSSSEHIDIAICFSDGYRYYYDSESNLNREEFY